MIVLTDKSSLLLVQLGFQDLNKYQVSWIGDKFGARTLNVVSAYTKNNKVIRQIIQAFPFPNINLFRKRKYRASPIMSAEDHVTISAKSISNTR